MNVTFEVSSNFELRASLVTSVILPSKDFLVLDDERRDFSSLGN